MAHESKLKAAKRWYRFETLVSAFYIIKFRIVALAL